MTLTGLLSAHPVPTGPEVHPTINNKAQHMAHIHTPNAQAVARKAAAKVTARNEVAKRFTPTQLRQAGRQMAQDGINGDTIVAHIGPAEAALLKQRGGVGTINPRTGLPQYYDQGTDGSNQGGGQGDTGTTGGDGGFGGGNSGGNGMGQDEGHGEYGPGAPGSVGNNGMMGNAVGANGQLSQASGLSQLDKAAVGATSSIGMGPGAMTGINASQDIMNGVTPGFADMALDKFGIGNPGGFLGSNGALSGASMIGGLLAGPPGAAAAAGLAAGLQGRSLGATLGAAAGGLTGIGASTGASYGGSMAGNGLDAAVSNANSNAAGMGTGGAGRTADTLAASPYLGGNLPGFDTAPSAPGQAPQGIQWGANLQAKLNALQGGPMGPMM